MYKLVRNLLPAALLLVGAAATDLHAADPLKVGDPAPDFTLPAATKDSIMYSGITLSAVEGKSNIILAFYPADWSSGCTMELCNMRDNFSSLAGLGATVFGISGDYVFAHHQWAKDEGFPFVLLSDHLHEVARQYQSYNAAHGYNLRTIYVIDRSGKIAYIDLAYKAGSEDSFNNLKAALAKLQASK